VALYIQIILGHPSFEVVVAVCLFALVVTFEALASQTSRHVVIMSDPTKNLSTFTLGVLRLSYSHQVADSLNPPSMIHDNHPWRFVGKNGEYCNPPINSDAMINPLRAWR